MSVGIRRLFDATFDVIERVHEIQFGDREVQIAYMRLLTTCMEDVKGVGDRFSYGDSSGGRKCERVCGDDSGSAGVISDVGSKFTISARSGGKVLEHSFNASPGIGTNGVGVCVGSAASGGRPDFSGVSGFGVSIGVSTDEKGGDVDNVVSRRFGVLRKDVGELEGSLNCDKDDGLVIGLGCRSKGQKKRDRLRRQNIRRKAVGADEVVSDESDESVVKGRCETVVSQVQPVQVDSVKDRVPAWRRKASIVGVQPAVASVPCQEAEQMARETLALRRAMENKVAVRKAELQLRSLNDEKKCQDYEDLKRQRVIQWQNQALAKSQSSAKSLDPDSSVSMREFREQAKHCADLEYKQKKIMRVVGDLYGGMAALKVLDAVEAVGEGTLMDQEAQDVCGDGGPEVWGFDVDEVGVY